MRGGREMSEGASTDLKHCVPQSAPSCHGQPSSTLTTIHTISQYTNGQTIHVKIYICINIFQAHVKDCENEVSIVVEGEGGEVTGGPLAQEVTRYFKFLGRKKIKPN